MKVGFSALAIALAPALSCASGSAQQQKLERERDEILPRLEAITGMQSKRPIPVALRDRERLRAYLERQLDEEFPADERNALREVYSMLGLVPDTIDLGKLYVALYTEQVVGYYDPDSTTLYVVSSAAPRDRRAVLAHELVHALQDQYVSLDSLIDPARGNDPQTAAQAAIEGHATLAMLLFQSSSDGRTPSPDALPDLGETLRPALERENDRFPVFRDAPPLIRELLLFPYLRGAGFIQEIWRAADSARMPDFAASIPASTEQVLHAPLRFIAVRDAPTALVLDPSPAGWSDVYENGFGELECGILLRETIGGDAASLASGWDGDRYRLLRSAGGRFALVWDSVWDDDASADAFAAAMREAARRWGATRAVWVRRADFGGRAGVEVSISRPGDAAVDALPEVHARVVDGVR